MKRAFATLCIAVVLAACTWTQTLVGEDGRRNAKVALTAYEATQQAMLIYGHLPGCDAEAGVVVFCRDQAVWVKIKTADKVATLAIMQAAPVLQGEAIDAGQVVKALIAIQNVKVVLQEAQAKLKGGMQ